MKGSNMKLGKKIMLLAVGAQLFLVCAAAFGGYSALRSHHALLAESTLALLETTSANLGSIFAEIDTLTYSMLGDDVFQQELSSIAGTSDLQQQLSSYHTLYDRLIRYEQENRRLGIKHIHLQTSAYTVLTDYQKSAVTHSDTLNALTSAASANNGLPVYDTALCSTGDLLVARSIRQVTPFTLTPIGTMILDLDLDKLVAQATNHTAQLDSLHWIIDDGGTVFYQSSALTEEDLTLISGNISATPHVISLPDGHYFMCHGQLNVQSGWGYTLLLPYETQWQMQMRSIAIFLLALLSALMLAFLLSRATVRAITRDINALLGKMNLFQAELTQTSIAPPFQTDTQNEIAVLHVHFDRMTERINTLIQEKYISELLIKDAQLQALEAQTNPHFLYNVLETINCRAKLSGHQDIATIAEALGRLLRVSLDRRSKLIPLRQELSLVDDYLAIQRLRYENQLSYTLSVPDELMNVQIPKLSIQPLVENAIHYALEGGIDDYCSISVSACIHPDHMVIAVQNTGSAFPEPMLGMLQPDAVVPHGFGIGLSNIHRRLQLTYGDQGYLYLKNVDGQAVCELRIPLNHSASGRKDAC